MLGRRLIARETVAMETPVFFATSRISNKPSFKSEPLRLSEGPEASSNLKTDTKAEEA